jgi:hypothetical protein
VRVRSGQPDPRRAAVVAFAQLKYCTTEAVFLRTFFLQVDMHLQVGLVDLKGIMDGIRKLRLPREPLIIRQIHLPHCCL